MIQYISKIPSKIEYYELVRDIYKDFEVSEIAVELNSTITCICAYKGERLVGMGRVKKEGAVLCIEDLIVKLDAYKEEIENTIIVGLVNEVNRLKLFDSTIRDCLDMSVTEDPVKSMHEEENNDVNMQEKLIYGTQQV